MMAVASAGPYANNLHLAPGRQITTSLNFYMPDALRDTQPTCQSTHTHTHPFNGPFPGLPR